MKGDLYMHVLEGQPAQFDPKNGQIFIGARKIKRLASSLRQIRREQRQSVKFYGEVDTRLYRHVRITREALK